MAATNGQSHESDTFVKLPYSLHSRYPAIAIAWTVIIIPPIFINLGLFYGLWYGNSQMDRVAGLFFPNLGPADHTHDH